MSRNEKEIEPELPTENSYVKYKCRDFTFWSQGKHLESDRKTEEYIRKTMIFKPHLSDIQYFTKLILPLCNHFNATSVNLLNAFLNTL